MNKDIIEFVVCGHCEEWVSSPFGRIKHIPTHLIRNYVLYSLLLNIGGKSIELIEEDRLKRNERLSLKTTKAILSNYTMDEMDQYNNICDIIKNGNIQYQVTSSSQITINIEDDYRKMVMDKAEYELKKMSHFKFDDMDLDPTKIWNKKIKDLLDSFDADKPYDDCYFKGSTKMFGKSAKMKGWFMFSKYNIHVWKIIYGIIRAKKDKHFAFFVCFNCSKINNLSKNIDLDEQYIYASHKILTYLNKMQK